MHGGLLQEGVRSPLFMISGMPNRYVFALHVKCRRVLEEELVDPNIRLHELRITLAKFEKGDRKSTKPCPDLDVFFHVAEKGCFRIKRRMNKDSVYFKLYANVPCMVRNGYKVLDLHFGLQVVPEERFPGEYAFLKALNNVMSNFGRETPMVIGRDVVVPGDLTFDPSTSAFIYQSDSSSYYSTEEDIVFTDNSLSFIETAIMNCSAEGTILGPVNQEYRKYVVLSKMLLDQRPAFKERLAEARERTTDDDFRVLTHNVLDQVYESARQFLSTNGHA